MSLQLTIPEGITRDSYNTIAAWHGARGRRCFWQAAFNQFNMFLPHGEIIDIGCGTGVNAPNFLNAGYDYTGIDVSEGMVREAQKYVPHGVFRVMDMYQLDFPKKKFNGFWSTASLIHIPKDRIQLIFNELRRVVKRGGVGFISMREGKGEKLLPIQEQSIFYVYYNLEEFAGLLDRSGFIVLKKDRDLRNYSPPRDITVWLNYIVKVR